MFSHSPFPQSSHRTTEQLPAAPLRRWRAPVDDEVTVWSITFSDLVLLLLCFFILWHVAEKRAWLSTLPVKSTEPVLTGQQTALPISPPRESTLTSAEPRGAEPQQPPDHLVETRSVEPPSRIMREEQPAAQSTETKPDWTALQTQLNSYVHAHGLDRTVGVISTEQGLVISLSDTITFPSGQATLSPAVEPLLAQVAVLATEQPDLDIEITGHTDDRQIATTKFPSNWELSAARATRVARALLERNQIDPTRISTRGYASYRPIYQNDTEEHRAANRRVEIRFFQPVESPY
jgi:chemotaxis protein MotB